MANLIFYLDKPKVRLGAFEKNFKKALNQTNCIGGYIKNVILEITQVCSFSYKNKRGSYIQPYHIGPVPNDVEV